MKVIVKFLLILPLAAVFSVFAQDFDYSSGFDGKSGGFYKNAAICYENAAISASREGDRELEALLLKCTASLRKLGEAAEGVVADTVVSDARDEFETVRAQAVKRYFLVGGKTFHLDARWVAAFDTGADLGKNAGKELATSKRGGDIAGDLNSLKAAAAEASAGGDEALASLYEKCSAALEKLASARDAGENVKISAAKDEYRQARMTVAKKLLLVPGKTFYLDKRWVARVDDGDVKVERAVASSK